MPKRENIRRRIKGFLIDWDQVMLGTYADSQVEALATLDDDDDQCLEPASWAHWTQIDDGCWWNLVLSFESPPSTYNISSKQITKSI